MSATSEQPDLEPLLRAASGGDHEAWRLIVDRYSTRVYGLLHAQCGNRDLAEEITQSTFCTVAAKLGAYTESGRFESWLFRIAMNRLRDEMRRRKRQATTVAEDTLAGLADPGGGAGTDAGGTAAGVAEDELEALQTAISALPAADQRIVHLRHHGDLSFRQIADVLGQPVGTVLARHHRALKKLRDLMLRDLEET